MKKDNGNIAKEIFIMIALLILVILIVAVMLYEYIPNSITISEPISYSSSSATTAIKQEISYTNGGDTLEEDTFEIDGESITSLKSYSIESSDLKVYSEKNLYNQGNSNPFDYAIEDETKENGNKESNANTKPNSQTTEDKKTTQGTSNNATTGTFFETSSSK